MIWSFFGEKDKIEFSDFTSQIQYYSEKMLGKGMVRCILCEAFINLREGRFAFHLALDFKYVLLGQQTMHLG